MADEADRAQVQVDAFLAASLANVRAIPGPSPEIVDGVACCAECGEPIPPARLAKVPKATRCTKCQEEKESPR